VGKCSQERLKYQWYLAEQRLRNQIDRTYDVEMSFKLTDLQEKVPGSGVDHPPPYKIKSFLGIK
jgi:hypothetical protein